MASIWFVTGTDTGVGKTVISSALTAGLRAAGRRVVGLKPMETGCAWQNGRMQGEDQQRLAEAAGDPGLETGLYRFEPPLAPSVAARMAGEPIDLERVADWVRSRAEGVDHLVVEGVGGLMVTLTDDATVVDLIRGVRPDGVVRVSINRLGVLSQVLTAARVLEAEGLPLRGVVLNEATGAAGLAEETNRAEMLRWVRPVVSFPALPEGAAIGPALAEAGQRLAEGLGLLAG